MYDNGYRIPLNETEFLKPLSWKMNVLRSSITGLKEEKVVSL